MRTTHIAIALAFVLCSALPALGQRPSMNSDDTWNLGCLGAKGKVVETGRGGQAIAIHHILPDSPAQAAGLATGDLISAVDGRVFPRKVDPALALVTGLEAGSSRKTPVVKLTVLREGKPTLVRVSLPALGPHGRSCPRGCQRCAAWALAGLDFLKKTQGADGSWGYVTGGNNGRVAVASLAGLAFLAAGSTAHSGPYADSLKKTVRFVERTLEAPDRFGGVRRGTGGANWNQENWKLGYAGMFLAEVYKGAPNPKLLALLTRNALRILKNQEPSGGWAHGPGGPNALGYLELEIVSNYVLSALGCARQCGVAVDDAKVKKAFAYIMATGPGDGGVGYSTRSGQKGHGEPGRTSGAIVAFSSLGHGRHPFCAKMGKYLLRRMRKLPDGHVSPMMHLWFGSLACHNQGPAHTKKYWTCFRLRFAAARRPDGAFDSWPTRESVQLRSNSDRQMGLSWSTASLVLPLLLHRGHLRLLVANKK